MLTIYLIVGAFAGLMSGLFGVGGGVVVIPALAALFLHHTTIPQNYIMQMAIGTSLAIMVLTSSSALYAHHQRHSVRWDFFQRMLPGLVVGAIIGAIMTRFLPSHYLQMIFGIFLFLVGLQIMFSRLAMNNGKALSTQAMHIVSGLIGLLSSLLGVSGGVLLVPFLLYCRIDLREATGTSIACGLSIGIVATISLMIAGLFVIKYTPWSTGYIYWPAFLGVAVASMIFAPIGAMLAHKLPRELLKHVFGVFLLLVACDMLWSSYRS